MKEFSIRHHVALLTFTPLLIMAISLESFFLHDRFTDLDHDLTERGQLIARQIAAGSEYGLFSNNRFYLQNIAQAAIHQPDMRRVIILDAEGEIIYEEEALSSAKANPSASAEAGIAPALVNMQNPLLSNNKSLWIYQPIIPAQVGLDEQTLDSTAAANPRQIGSVILELSREQVVQMKSQLFWGTVGASLLFLAFPCVLIFLFSRGITTPIGRLSDAVLRIGNGELETRIPLSSKVSELNVMARGINDMAEKLQQENATLRQREREATRIAAIAFESHEGMMVTDADGVIIRVNSAFTKITGYTSEEAVGQTPKLLKSGVQDDDFYASMWDRINCTGVWQGEIWNRRKNGEIFPVWAAITAVEKEDGTAAYYVATYTDITQRKAAEQEINTFAFYDTLTQLPNRRMFFDRFSKALAASKRSGRFGALMFLDLDNFKPINDRYGHAAGDSLLIEAARRLSGCVREVDTVARFGGDEFVVMLGELDFDRAESAAQAGIVAEKIRDTLALPYKLEVHAGGHHEVFIEHCCTTSIGVVLFSGHDVSDDELVKHADRAMYHAKQSGRNTIRFHGM